MKQLLIALSTLTTLTLASNGIDSTINANTTINNSFLNKSSVNDSVTSLFNNQWSVLSTSDWITNQSTTDHKFYSYDTSALKSYTFANAQSTFLVDTRGNLVYNPKVTVPDKDKIDIENTKQEIITARKITTIKDDYNPYSKSEYSILYFNGDNNNWQYIQLGGVEKHIDISKQAGADKVENSNNLSETLGLYYIAKAVISNKIDKTIAQQLASNFISKSSLKGQINDELVTKIIDLIIDNKDIYNFIYHAPFYVSDKNYSLNYIFDNSNNLIEVYYNKWNDTNINKNINYSWSDQYGFSNYNDNSNKYVLLKWSDCARNWNTFINKYSTFNFDNSSKFIVTTTGGTSNSSKLVNKISMAKVSTTNSSLYHIHTSYESPWIPRIPTSSVDLSADLDIWHDDNNIYYQWFLKVSINNSGIASFFNCALKNVTFNNAMN